MRRKTIKILCALLAALLLFSACAGDAGQETPADEPAGGEESGQTAFSLTLPYYPNDSLNPYFAASALNRALASLFCEPLYRVGSDYTPHAVLAASAENSGTTLTVTLADAHFSDGAAVSAADVVYSFERAKESGWYASRLSSVTAARRSGAQVVFTLAAPNVYAANLLTFPIVRSGTADDAESVPTGTGVFTLSADGTLSDNPSSQKTCAAQSVTLFAVKDTAHLVNALEIGNISYLFDDFDDGTYSRPSARTTFVTMNNLVYLGVSGTGVLQSSAVRTAIYYAVDQANLAASAYRGCAEGAALPFHPAFCAAQNLSAGKTAADPDTAADILSRLGYNRYNADGLLTNGTNTLEMTLLVNAENTFRVTAAYAIAESLNAAGFSVTVESVPSADYLNRIAAGQFTLYLGEVKLGEDLSLSPFFAEGGAAAAGIDKTLPVCSAYTAFCAGETDAAAFCEAFLDDMPFIPLCYRSGLAAYSAQIAPDFSTAAYDMYGDITLWKANG